MHICSVFLIYTLSPCLSPTKTHSLIFLSHILHVSLLLAHILSVSLLLTHILSDFSYSHTFLLSLSYLHTFSLSHSHFHRTESIIDRDFKKLYRIAKKLLGFIQLYFPQTFRIQIFRKRFQSSTLP